MDNTYAVQLSLVCIFLRGHRLDPGGVLQAQAAQKRELIRWCGLSLFSSRGGGGRVRITLFWLVGVFVQVQSRAERESLVTQVAHKAVDFAGASTEVGFTPYLKTDQLLVSVTGVTNSLNDKKYRTKNDIVILMNQLN